MALFNAVQIVAIFVAMPFLIGWLHGNPFAYSAAIKWLCVAGYVAAAGYFVSLVWRDIEGPAK